MEAWPEGTGVLQCEMSGDCWVLVHRGAETVKECAYINISVKLLHEKLVSVRSLDLVLCTIV